MSDRFPASIEIGGRVPKRLLKKLAEIVESEGAYLGSDFDGDCNFKGEEELVKAAGLKEVFALSDDMMRGGDFESLEAFCEKNKISFKRQSAGYCEYLPEISLFLPDSGMKKAKTVYCTDNGEPLVALSSLKDVQTNPGKKFQGFADLIRYLEFFQNNVPPLEIV